CANTVDASMPISLLSPIHLRSPSGLERSLHKKKRTRTPRRKERPRTAAAEVGAPTEVSKDRRRSERLSTSIPAILLGKDVAGREFFDRSEIISVDDRGARMRTRFLLRLETI